MVVVIYYSDSDKIIREKALGRVVRSDIWSEAIAAGGRPRTFLIHPCRASTGRTRCRCPGSGRPWTAGSGSWTPTSCPSSWPFAAWVVSGRPTAVSRMSAVAAWSGSWDRCLPCASAPCCTPRSATAAGGPSGTRASPSPNGIFPPNSAPTRLSSAPGLCLQNEKNRMRNLPLLPV